MLTATFDRGPGQRCRVEGRGQKPYEGHLRPELPFIQRSTQSGPWGLASLKSQIDATRHLYALGT